MCLDTFAKEYRVLLSTFTKECHLRLCWTTEQTFGIMGSAMDGGMPHGRKPLYQKQCGGIPDLLFSGWRERH